MKASSSAFKKCRDEGELIGIQKMLMVLLIEKNQDSDVLQSLFRVILKCESLSEFETALSRV